MTSVEDTYFDPFYVEPLKLEWGASSSYVLSIPISFEPEETYTLIGMSQNKTTTSNFKSKVEGCQKVSLEHWVEGEIKAIYRIKK